MWNVAGGVSGVTTVGDVVTLKAVCWCHCWSYYQCWWSCCCYRSCIRGRMKKSRNFFVFHFRSKSRTRNFPRHLFSLVSSHCIYFQTLLKFNLPFAENFRSLVGNRWQSSLHFRQHTRNSQTSLRQNKTILLGKTKFCPEVIEVAQQKSATSNHFNILGFDWEKH